MSTDLQAVGVGSDDDGSPRVFVTYSHDSTEHKELVRRFATFLRKEAGVDAHLDQWYDGERRDWSAWAIDQLNQADFIVVIASPAYLRRADGLAPADEGRGAQFEAAIIRNNLTRNLPKETRRILPVVLPGRSIEEIPSFLNAYSTTRYVVSEYTLEDDGVKDLLAAFTGVPQYRMPPRGPFAGSPFADQPQTASPSTSTPARSKTRLLTVALQPVKRGPDLRMGGADLNGTHYGNSIVHRCSAFCGGTRSAIEYNLGRRFRAFKAVVGVLDDAADADQNGYFQVFLDGEAQQQVQATHGVPVGIQHDVTGVLRLRLIAYRPDTVASPLMAGAMMAGGRSNRLPALAWGDPKLFE